MAILVLVTTKIDIWLKPDAFNAVKRFFSLSPNYTGTNYQSVCLACLRINTKIEAYPSRGPLLSPPLYW